MFIPGFIIYVGKYFSNHYTWYQFSSLLFSFTRTNTNAQNLIYSELWAHIKETLYHHSGLPLPIDLEERMVLSWHAFVRLSLRPTTCQFVFRYDSVRAIAQEGLPFLIETWQVKKSGKFKHMCRRSLNMCIMGQNGWTFGSYLKLFLILRTWNSIPLDLLLFRSNVFILRNICIFDDLLNVNLGG